MILVLSSQILKKKCLSCAGRYSGFCMLLDELPSELNKSVLQRLAFRDSPCQAFPMINNISVLP